MHIKLGRVFTDRIDVVGLFKDPLGVSDFLSGHAARRANLDLDNRRPIEAISESEANRVLALIEGLAAGVVL